jgi:hypothetical protein
LARRSADERYDPLKLGGAKLWRDLIDAAVMEQEDSRDHVFGHALGGGPDLFLRMKLENELVRLGQEDIPAPDRRARRGRPSSGQRNFG